jgi:haloalkane dehalogenase
MLNVIDPTGRRKLDIGDITISYVDTGTPATGGPTAVFLHGNPTSSILWRNVIPWVSDLMRCVAPDLPGMGHSSAAGERCGFLPASRVLDDLLDALDIGSRVVLVLHDWGSALGFDWASRHCDRVAGIAYMEAIVTPLTRDDLGDTWRTLSRLRSESGEHLVLDENLFIESVLPSWVMRGLSQDETRAYAAPYAIDPESRRPLLAWVRDLPVDGEPSHIAEIVESYSAWLATADFPKLFVNASPGAFLTGRPRDLCRSWPNQTEVTVPGIHLLQEDSAHLIGGCLRAWVHHELANLLDCEA